MSKEKQQKQPVTQRAATTALNVPAHKPQIKRLSSVKPDRFSVSKQGWMQKLQKFDKKMHSRWFVLGEGSLIYFVSQNKWENMAHRTLTSPDTTDFLQKGVKKFARGAIPLKDAKIVSCTIPNVDPNRSFTVKTSKKTYDFVCDTKEECELWKTKIKSEIKESPRAHLTIDFQIADEMQKKKISDGEKGIKVDEEEIKEAEKHQKGLEFVKKLCDDLKKSRLEYAANEIEEHYTSFLHSRSKHIATLTHAQAKIDEGDEIGEEETAVHPEEAKWIKEDFQKSLIAPPKRKHKEEFVEKVEQSPISVDRKYDYLKEVLQKNKINTLDRITPYDNKFLHLNIPVFSAVGGLADDFNETILNGPSNKHFYEIEEGKDKEISIVFLGDVCILNKEMPPSVHTLLKSRLKTADIVVMNIEAAISHISRDKTLSVDTGTKLYHMSRDFISEMCMRIECDPCKTLFNLANNHCTDAGKTTGIITSAMNISVMGGLPLGVSETEDGKKRGIICKIKIKGQNLGFVSWTHWVNREAKDKRAPIFRQEDILKIKDWKALKKKHNIDVLIGYVHWDFENANHPSLETSTFAQELWTRGFDLIVGQGTHTLLPMEVFDTSIDDPNRGLVFYGLGNFIAQKSHPLQHLGGFLDVSIAAQKITKYRLTPVVHGGMGKRIVSAPLSAVPRADPNYRNWWTRVAMQFYDDSEYITDLVEGVKETYAIRIHTSDIPFACTHDARVILTCRGENAASPNWVLDAITAGLPSTDDVFQKGQEDRFFFSSPWELGELKSVKVTLQCRKANFHEWHLDNIVIVNMTKKKDYLIRANKWFKEKENVHIFPIIEDKSSIKKSLDSVEITALKKFAELESRIQTGDIFCFNCYDSLGSFIRFFTRSAWTHVNILVVNETKKIGELGRVICYEATANDCRIPDISSGNLYYAGVHCFDAKQVLMNYSGDIYWLPRKDRKPLNEKQKGAIIQYCERLHQKKELFSYMQLYGVGMRDIFGLESAHHAITYTPDTQVYCAELLTSALQCAGLISGKVNPAAVLPADVVHWPLFDAPHMIRIKTWNPTSKDHHFSEKEKHKDKPKEGEIRTQCCVHHDKSKPNDEAKCCDHGHHIPKKK